MSVRTSTTFVCDRCDREQEVDRSQSGTFEQPHGWSRLTITSPPLASPTEGDVLANQLVCPRCTETLRYPLLAMAPDGGES